MLVSKSLRENLARVSLSVLLTSFAVCASVRAEEAACTVAAAALEQAVKIRGLERKSQVPCLVSDKAQVAKFLRETIATKLPPNKIEMEQLVYRTLGVVPEDYDYANGIIELYASQIGGYYDPEKKHFIMAAWMPAALQVTVAVHELTHALQDQHFDLEKMMDPKLENGDKLLAIAALVEGDATAVMTDYMRALAGQAPLSKESNIDSLLLQQVLAGSAGGFEKTPEALRSLLLFPYTSGLRFAHRLLVAGGYPAVDKAFLNPPTSSREILHPEVYLTSSIPSSIPSLEELDRGGSTAKELYTDVIGEFGISALLAAGLKQKTEAITAATGWLGDRVGVFETPSPERLVSWKTRWESEKDAQEFAEAYGRFLESRYSTKPSPDGTYATRRKTIRISRSGADVSVVFVAGSTAQ
jgi:hypothetical protein